MENNKNRYRIDSVMVVAVILQLVFMIFAGITIYNILSKNIGIPTIKISNYSVIPEGEVIGEYSGRSNGQKISLALDDDAKNIIENAIYEVVSINNIGEILNHGAKIREGSARYAYIEGLNTYVLNFIVDLEELKQSYRFVWSWGDSSLRREESEIMLTMAFCPSEDEMIYGSFDCRDNYDGHGLDIVVYNLLRYKMFSNFTVGLSDVYSGQSLTISINIGSNNDSARDTAVSEVSNYLDDLGFNLEDFEYTTKFIEVAN